MSTISKHVSKTTLISQYFTHTPNPTIHSVKIDLQLAFCMWVEDSRLALFKAKLYRLLHVQYALNRQIKINPTFFILLYTESHMGQTYVPNVYKLPEYCRPSCSYVESVKVDDDMNVIRNSARSVTWSHSLVSWTALIESFRLASSIITSVRNQIIVIMWYYTLFRYTVL